MKYWIGWFTFLEYWIDIIIEKKWEKISTPYQPQTPKPNIIN